jgi:hypothetical protein
MTAMEAARAGHGPAVRRAGWFHLATFVVGLTGLFVQLVIIVRLTDDPTGRDFPLPVRLWNLVSYFTIWSNILVTAVAFVLWRDPGRHGPTFAVVRLASLAMITVTGIVYALVLAPIWDPTGWSRVADETLHYAVPALAIAGYLLFGPRPRLGRRALWWSAVIPLVWGVYTLARGPLISFTRDGETHHWYPYPFIDVDELGYGRAFVNMLAITVLLLVVAGIYVFLDRKLAPRPAPAGPATEAAVPAGPTT